MTCCGFCGILIDSDELSCNNCSIKYHKTCIAGSDNVITCPNCKVEIEVHSTDGISPMEYEPSTPQTVETSQVDYRNVDRNLVCVLFPGIVKNEEKAIQCLGGLKGIAQVYSQPQKRRLGLNFQPDNPFIKRVFADCKKAAGVLLKIKVRKVKTNNEVQRKIISTDLVGRVSRIYRFESMCDFQYLPLYKQPSDQSLHCIIEEMIPTKFIDLNFFKEDTPLFIVPANFTRFDRPISYAYTDKKYPDNSNANNVAEDEYHKRSRTERGMPLGHWWNFNMTEEFPSKPDELHLKTRDTKYEFNPILKDEFKIIEKCFEERPIWSLNMLRFQTKLRLGALKILVPCVAVFMRDGPWRSLWIKYGFDPRIEPLARIYQTLDFRLRHQAGVHQMVMTRDQVAHYKSADRVRPQKRRNLAVQPPSEEIGEGAVLFRPGMMPTQRQIFYQLCDVKIPEVEAIIGEEPMLGTVCHEKYGWLPSNTVDKCRDLVFQYVKKTALATNSADLKFDDIEGGSSDDDSNNSGDDITNAMDESIMQ